MGGKCRKCNVIAMRKMRATVHFKNTVASTFAPSLGSGPEAEDPRVGLPVTIVTREDFLRRA